MTQIKKNYKTIIYSLFIILSLIPFILQFILDTDLEMPVVNFSFIVLCFITTLLTFNKTKHNLLQLGAITFTLIADYFLTLKEIYYTFSIILFTIVQIFYFIRILDYSNTKEIKINIIFRIIIVSFIAFISLTLLKSVMNELIIVALFYYVNFLVNVIFSFVHFKNNKLLALGLLLFILCDTMIGFQEMVGIFNLSKDSFIYIISQTAYNIPWMFYIPAQILLLISKNG